MRIRSFVLPISCLAVITLSGCGGGGGGGGDTEAVTASPAAGTDVTNSGNTAAGGPTAPLPIPTKGVLKMATSGAASTINGIDVTVTLPAGVTVAADPVTGEVTNGVVTASGVAAVQTIGTQNVITARYAPASSATPAQLHIVMANMPGFNLGEFVTIQFDLTTGTSFPAANAFNVTNFFAKGLDGLGLSGITAAPSSATGL
jgi:hypothetical protein